jgi:hypothetical protein
MDDLGRREALRSAGKRDIEIWNLRTCQWRSHSHCISRIAHLEFSRDAMLLAAAGLRPSGGVADQASLRLWETASGAIAGASPTYLTAAFSFRPTAPRLDPIGWGVVVWDLGSGRSVAEIEENFTWIGDLAISHDDRLLVTGSEEPVVNIPIGLGKRIDSLKGSRICIDGVG